jgi:hypothetical protein
LAKTSKDMFIRLFFVILFVIEKDWKEHKCPSVEEFCATLEKERWPLFDNMV